MKRKNWWCSCKVFGNFKIYFKLGNHCDLKLEIECDFEELIFGNQK